MATKSQGLILRVSSAALAADNITAITAANPPVVTATAHGIANGAIVAAANIGGMTQLNNRAFVVANQTTNTVELKGIDATGYTAYTSGGTLTEHTMIAVGEVRSVPEGFNGTAAEIDSTHMTSTAMEIEQGLQDFGTVTMEVNLVTDTGQARLRALKEGQLKVPFSITLSDGRVTAFMAFVASFSFSAAGPNTIVSGSITLRVSNAPAWFA